MWNKFVPLFLLLFVRHTKTVEKRFLKYNLEGWRHNSMIRALNDLPEDLGQIPGPT